VRISPTRPRFLVLAGLLPALALAASGFAWEAWRLGTTASGTSARVESFVRDAFANRAAELASLTDRAATLTPDVRIAVANRDALPQVFLRLVDLTRTARGTASLTIYTPDYRPLAWSDGPAEDLAPERLRGSDSIFVTEGTLGLRLVRTRQLRVANSPADGTDRLVATVAAETLLPPAVGGPAERHRAFPSPFGDITLVLPTLSSAGDNLAHPNSFMVNGPGGAPLVEARYDPSAIAERRQSYRRIVWAVAGLPLVLCLLLTTGVALDRRRAARDRAGFALWTTVLSAIVISAGAAAVALASLAGVTTFALLPLAGLVAVALAAAGPISLWLRRRQRRDPSFGPMAFAVEQAIAAAASAGVLLWMVGFLRPRPGSTPVERWGFPLLPVSSPERPCLAGTLLVVAAAIWSAAALLAVAAERWRVQPASKPATLGAVLIWSLAFGLAGFYLRDSGHPVSLSGFAVVAIAISAFGVMGARVRRYYRHTTQAARLGLLYLGLFLPVVVAYPATQSLADATARSIIERDYSSAVQRAAQPQHLQEELSLAQAEIDAFPSLADIINRSPQTPTQAAYTVWSQTRLARNRVTSAIELYDDDGALVSRFALNVPEYGAPAAGDRVSNCVWTQSGEAGRFGAEERRMLRGERALCNPSGPPRGAIVVHLMPDYRPLPFVSSDDPYYHVFPPGGIPRRSPLRHLPGPL